ncbi:hypothetical protein HanIR_Chr11g0505011 [Helianthus annuus]|nr:hypothetical protein HanIR_Chr11g0505011 [Helianthus annuus]
MRIENFIYRGRVILLKAVLDSLPVYHFSIFKAPKGVLDDIEALRRRFYWGGDEEKSKTSWVCWERVVYPVDKGGLGLGALRDMNISLLTKCWCRFKTEWKALWKEVVSSIHFKANPSTYLPIKAALKSKNRADANSYWVKQLCGLENWNIHRGSTNCRLCGDVKEDTNHLLTSCFISIIIWQNVSRWCKVPPIAAATVREMLNFHQSADVNGYKKYVVCRSKKNCSTYSLLTY